MKNSTKEKNQEEIFSRIIFESNKADSILDLIRKNIRLIIDFFSLEGGAIYFLEGETANLFINFDLSPEFVKNFTTISSALPMFKEVFSDKECFVLDKKTKTDDAKLVRSIGYNTLISVPIFYHRRVVGCYVICGEEARKFSKKDLDLMVLAGKEIGSFLDQVVSDISIKKEKQNFKSFFNSLKDIVLVFDTRMRILEVNSFACKRLFYSRSQILRKSMEEIFSSKDWEGLSSDPESFVSGDPFVASLREKDGDNVLVEANVIKGTWSNDDAYFLIAKDISKVREVETRLEESEYIHASLMANISNYVIICRKDGTISYVNNSASKVLGYRDFKSRKRNIEDFLELKNRKDVRSRVVALSAGTRLDDYETRIVGKKEGVHDVIVSGSLIDYQKEESILFIMTDITNRKQAESLIRERTSELEDSQKALMNVLEDVEEEKNKVIGLAQDLEKFKLAVENTSDHIVITDKEGILLYANRGAEAMTGFSVREIIGKKCGGKDTWGGLMSKDFYIGLWSTLKKEKKSFKGEISNRRKDGTPYIAMATISPVMDKDGEVLFFVGIERDITKDKEIDRAKSEFVSLASHQLRTPLSIINWYTELLLNEDSGELNDEQKSYLEEIVGGNERMVDLVGALLNVSRIEMGNFAINPKKTDIIKVAESILRELFIKFESRDVDLDFKYDDLPLLDFDSKLFGIIVDNLVGNAIKYTPDGGKVSFRIKKDKRGIVMTVADNGYGISRNDKDKIFTKLYRGENIQEKVADGNGLGLYIVKSIVDQSGGSIWFDSEEGKGTTFYVTFPLSGMKKKSGDKEID
jgi:PAS domain S-box-containing protein